MIEFLASALRIASPIMLAALGGIIIEKGRFALPVWRSVWNES